MFIYSFLFIHLFISFIHFFIFIYSFIHFYLFIYLFICLFFFFFFFLFFSFFSFFYIGNFLFYRDLILDLYVNKPMTSDIDFYFMQHIYIPAQAHSCGSLLCSVQCLQPRSYAGYVDEDICSHKHE